jgi:hypothetical protein
VIAICLCPELQTQDSATFYCGETKDSKGNIFIAAQETIIMESNVD